MRYERHKTNKQTNRKGGEDRTEKKTIQKDRNKRKGEDNRTKKERK